MTNREIDKEIAEKVMGYTHIPQPDSDNYFSGLIEFEDGKIEKSTFFFEPTQEISDAWLVVEKLAKNPKTNELTLESNSRGEWFVVFNGWDKKQGTSYCGGEFKKANTASKAISLAALEAVKK